MVEVCWSKEVNCSAHYFCSIIRISSASSKSDVDFANWARLILFQLSSLIQRRGQIYARKGCKNVRKLKL